MTNSFKAIFAFCGIFYHIGRILWLLLPWSGENSRSTGPTIDIDPPPTAGLGLDPSRYSKSDQQIIAQLNAGIAAGRVECGGISTPRFSSVH